MALFISPFSESARFYQIQKSKAITIWKPLRQHALDIIKYLKIQTSIVMVNKLSERIIFPYKSLNIRNVPRHDKSSIISLHDQFMVNRFPRKCVRISSIIALIAVLSELTL